MKSISAPTIRMIWSTSVYNQRAMGTSTRAAKLCVSAELTEVLSEFVIFTKTISTSRSFETSCCVKKISGTCQKCSGAIHQKVMGSWTTTAKMCGSKGLTEVLLSGVATFTEIIGTSGSFGTSCSMNTIQAPPPKMFWNASLYI